MIDKMIAKLEKLKTLDLSDYVIDQLQCISGELDETIEMMED